MMSLQILKMVADLAIVPALGYIILLERRLARIEAELRMLLHLREKSEL